MSTSSSREGWINKSFQMEVLKSGHLLSTKLYMIAPARRPGSKGKLIFQPQCFRYELLVYQREEKTLFLATALAGTAPEN